MRRRAVLPAAALSVVLLGACGVPMQQAAEPLPANFLPPPRAAATATPSTSATASPSPDPTAPATAETPNTAHLRLWFVQDDGLAAVESTLPSTATAADVVAALAVGPGDGDDDAELRTVARDPLTGSPLVAVSTEPSPVATSSAPTASPQVFYPQPSVTVRLSSAFSSLPPSEQVLLLGQVVLSLAGAGESSVAFADDAGTPVAVPLPDGRLLDGPATARDYTALIVRP